MSKSSDDPREKRAFDAASARALRAELTPPERLLWSRLRNRQLSGLKFRRQQPIGAFIADFYCAEAKLVVELDGQSHEIRKRTDRRRDAWMKAVGIETLRIGVPHLVRDVEAALALIERTAQRRIAALEPPHPNPLPQGEREQKPPHPNPLPQGEREQKPLRPALSPGGERVAEARTPALSPANTAHSDAR